MAVIEASNVCVDLTAGNARIVDDISFSLEAGEVVGVVGESGSGKSTLALALLNYARRGSVISGGSVRLGDIDLLQLHGKQLRQARREGIGYVPQDPPSALNPSLRLRTQLREAMRSVEGDARQRMAEILEAVALPTDDAFLSRRPRQLSGGQQQRVAIAMAVAAGPQLIVLDEPTTGLDVSTQAMVLATVRQLCASRGMAAVYITHDLAVVQDVADQLLVMYAGKAMEIGASAPVISTPAHPYTRALLNAVPSARERRPLVPIPGSTPSVDDVFTGCVFADRCDFVTAECRISPPELVRTAIGDLARCIHTDQVLAAPGRTEQGVIVREFDVAAESPVLAVENVSSSYGSRRVLNDVSLRLSAGECTAVVGESGSGKTTLARCVIGLQPVDEGAVLFNGEAVPPLAKKRARSTQRAIQYVFQNPFSSLNPRHTIGQSLALPLQHFYGLSGDAARVRVREALARVEMPSRLAERYPAELSGGQQQRAAIARALVCDPAVLICDEITSALDVSVQAAVVELLRGLLEGGLSILFVTHNLAVVRSIADSVVVLSEGIVVEQGPAEIVLDSPSHEYTKRLMHDTLEVTA